MRFYLLLTFLLSCLLCPQIGAAGPIDSTLVGPQFEHNSLVPIDTVYLEIFDRVTYAKSKSHAQRLPYRNELIADFLFNRHAAPDDIVIVTPPPNGFEHVKEKVRNYFKTQYRPSPKMKEEFGLPSRAGIDRYRVVARFDVSRIPRISRQEKSEEERREEVVSDVWWPKYTPEYMGGVDSLFSEAYKFYPKSLIAEGIEGDVIIGFVVNSENQITQVECLQERPAGYGFGQMGIKAMQRMKLKEPDQPLPANGYKAQQVIRFRVPR